MTTGSLIFAYNNDDYDYLKMAQWSMKNIHRHLDIPVCVVTDAKNVSEYGFDKVIQVESPTTTHRYYTELEKSGDWHNGDRPNAYNLTPWDTTIVLDADYVVASDDLRSFYSTNRHFLCHRQAYDLSFTTDTRSMNSFGKLSMPMWWATVMIFDKSQESEMIFTLMNMVRNHWAHYHGIFEFERSTYRNDYALSIALSTILKSDAQYSAFPWNLATVMPTHDLEKVDTDHYRVTYKNSENKIKYVEVVNQDFHAMCKTKLGDIIASSS